VIIPHDEIEPKFLWYRFNNERFWVKSGSAQPFVKVRASLEKTLLLPPLAEQRRIVAAIEEHFSRLAAAEESLRRANRRLGLFRRLVLRSTIEADYPTTTLADVAKVVSGQTPKGLVPLVEGPIPFFKVGDMNAAAGYEMAEARAYLDAELVETHRLRVRPAGTVIFPKRGGAIATNKKRILREPAAFDLNTMGLVPSERLLPEFLLYWLETKELSSLADGSNVPQINLPDIAPLQIPVPPLADQRRIVAEVERQLSLVDALAAATAAALKRSAALRRSILERAFTGKLVPQDPRDEPASVLLERIRAERAASERHQRPSTGRSRT
jgi:type I restriction enzyme S subunit